MKNLKLFKNTTPMFQLYYEKKKKNFFLIFLQFNYIVYNIRYLNGIQMWLNFEG